MMKEKRIKVASSLSLEKGGKLDFDALLKKFPWIMERGLNCILSPDSDGLLCGLLTSHFLGWNIRGFYDGKVLCAKKGIQPRNCVFLDMEIFRSGIRSVGQHMVMFDKNDIPINWANFGDSISANNIRNFDFKSNFKTKYPFGTVHLLLAILGRKFDITIPKSAVSALLYTDGVFKSQFNYPENCLGWLDFLQVDQSNNPLRVVFKDPHYSTYQLMIALSELFKNISAIGGGKRGGDKIKISDSKGRITNIDSEKGGLNEVVRNQAESFLRMLADNTGWTFIPEHWSWGPYRVHSFKKGSIKPGKARYNALLEQNPLSLAIISGNSIEFTIDEEDVF